MSSQSMIDTHREGAEVYHGAEICKKQSMSLLEELHLPRGLLPLACMEEVGYNRATGFVWLRQAKPTTHVFKAIGRTVSYAVEVTAFVEDRRMKRMTGVKSRELIIWVSLSDMYIDNPESKRITFRTSAGLGRSFPVSAFEVAEEGAAEKEAEAKKGDDENISGDRSRGKLKDVDLSGLDVNHLEVSIGFTKGPIYSPLIEDQFIFNYS